MVLLIPYIVLALYAQSKVKRTYAEFSQVASTAGLSSAETARRLLTENGGVDVQVEEVEGVLNDHYDPRDKTVRLASDIYRGHHLAGLAVAAHEVGHAIQHANSYFPLSVRNAFLPIANMGSTAAFPLFLIGFFLGGSTTFLMDLGIAFFAAVVATAEKMHVYAYNNALRRTTASFVTLRQKGELRGRMGTSAPIRALVVDVAHNSYSAALRDPRFEPVRTAELADLAIQISVLSPLEPISFRSEEELLAQLRPGVDGLMLEEGPHRGTFLPAAWDSIPEGPSFLCELKRKAGLAADYWSDSREVSRYTTESF